MNLWTIKTRRGKLHLDKLRSVWSWASCYSRAHVARLALALLAAIGVVSMQLVAPWPLKIVFDDVFVQRRGHAGWLDRLVRDWAFSPDQLLLGCCAAILVIAAFDAVLAYSRDVLLATTGQQIVGKIRQDLFRHLKTLPPSVFEHTSTGALLSRMTGDIQMLRQLLVDAFVALAQNLLLIVTTVVAMFWLDVSLACVGLLAVPITLVASWHIARAIQRATKQAREKESEVASIAHDVLGAMAIVQAFNREAIEQKRFTRENRSTVRAGVRSTRLESKLMRIVSLASAAALVGTLYVGAQGVLSHRITAGELLVFIAYLRMVTRPLREIAKIAGQAAKSTVCGQRIAELFAIQPAVTNKPGALELTHPRGDITFENVTFEYEPERPALRDVNLHVRAGERIAIVGPTGAGKSTLIKLLLRFHDPNLGRVCIDALDLRDVTTDSLRRCIGWVHQDTVLFGMSVADNITLGRPEADETLIRDVARRVHAHEFIDHLPQGLATVLGQNGVTLSGGQRQRLALARALLREPRILLLDEPATGLDARTRSIVEDAWLSPSNCATTIVICHRLHAMERFDRVVVMADGRIEAAGLHAELLASCSTYATLVRGASESSIVRFPEPAA